MPGRWLCNLSGAGNGSQQAKTGTTAMSDIVRFPQIDTQLGYNQQVSLHALYGHQQTSAARWCPRRSQPTPGFLEGDCGLSEARRTYGTTVGSRRNASTSEASQKTGVCIRVSGRN